MASGKSCSVENPDGIRRVVNGHTLAPRSKRRVDVAVNTVRRWHPISDGKYQLRDTVIETKVSKVFLD